MTAPSSKKITDNQKMAAAVAAGGALVAALVIKRRINVKTGKMLLMAAEGAVNEWVAQTEANGFKVIVLSNALVDQLTDNGMQLIPNAA